MKLPIIKSREDLEEILKGFEQQGFGYIADYTLNDRKIDSIINKNNTHNIDINKRQILALIDKETNYTKINKIVSKFFSKFNPDDKIKELLNNFYLHNFDTGTVPSLWSPGRNEILNWIKFKRKWGIQGDDFDYNVRVYNLNTNFIKLNFPDYSSNKFDNLYKLLFNEEPKTWKKRLFGSWQDLGKIEIRTFKNGSVNVKGDLEKIKEIFFEIYKNKSNTVILYKSKKIVNQKNED